MADSFDELYGKKGIDTDYEREKITYRPELRYSKEDIQSILRSEVKQSIERSRTFTITHNLYEYDELIAEVEKMLLELAARNNSDKIQQLNLLIQEKKHTELMLFEREESGYQQTGDYELYTILTLMKESMQTRRNFIDDRFRTQITSETDIKKIEEAELDMIDQWEQLEAKVMSAYKNMHTEQLELDQGHPLDDTSLTNNKANLDLDDIAQLEAQKRNKEILHVSLADTSYIHRNRYFMFLRVVEKAKTIVYRPESLIDFNLKEFLLNVGTLTSVSAAKTHLIIQFRKLREKHEGLKGRIATVEDGKESFASEKQYLLQQLEAKTVEPIKTWLYEQEEGSSGALDIFSKYMVSSLNETRKSYDETNADMLNFYKSESDFYEQQINFVKEKEKIRRFCRILEDLEDAGEIQSQWVDEYLKANGYTI